MNPDSTFKSHLRINHTRKKKPQHFNYWANLSAIRKKWKSYLNYAIDNYLHLVRRFWNHVLTCASVILSDFASAARSAEARYFCLWNRFSSSAICSLVKLVRGFLRLGGVLFW